MALELVHTFVSGLPPAADPTHVGGPEWDALHKLTAAKNTLAGNPTGADGDVTEVTLGEGLSFDTGALVQKNLLPATFILAPGGANLAVNTDVTEGQIVLPYDVVFKKVTANARTGPTGKDAIFDINLNGTTIWATQANRITIADGKTSGSQTAFDTAGASAGDILSIDIDQIGSGTPGKGVTIVLSMQSKLT